MTGTDYYTQHFISNHHQKLTKPGPRRRSSTKLLKQSLLKQSLLGLESCSSLSVTSISQAAGLVNMIQIRFSFHVCWLAGMVISLFDAAIMSPIKSGNLLHAAGFSERTCCLNLIRTIPAYKSLSRTLTRLPFHSSMSNRLSRTDISMVLIRKGCSTEQN